jgi:CHAD domain-containing protein
VAHDKEPEAKYHWKAAESVSEGLQRIVSQQLQLAVWQLSENAPSLDEAVHEARKSLKKIRSALRLTRSLLGREYDKENGVLRDAGRKLSPVRDSQALIEMFDELNGKYREKLGNRSLVSVRDGLVARKKELSSGFQRKRVRGNVLKSLHEVAARVKKWDLEEGDSRIVSQGFAGTIRRNRKACGDAYADLRPEGFHEWRKRAKDLRYQLGLLSKAWPPVLDGYGDAAKELESKLGDDHNLVVVRNTILEKPDNFGKEEDISAFLKIVEDHQQKLRSESRSLATRLYSEKPKYWRRRLDLCWSAWKQDIDREDAR